MPRFSIHKSNFGSYFFSHSPPARRRLLDFIRGCSFSSSSSPAGDRSGLRRTSAASFSLPACDCSGHCQTSTASVRSQWALPRLNCGARSEWALPDLNRRRPERAVGTAGPQWQARKRPDRRPDKTRDIECQTG